MEAKELTKYLFTPYRLPTGGHTADANVYQAEWVALAKAALEFFPGYYVHWYDPDIVLAKRFAPPVRLSVGQVKVLRDCRQAEIDALQEEVRLLRAEVRKQVVDQVEQSRASQADDVALSIIREVDQRHYEVMLSYCEIKRKLQRLRDLWSMKSED
jgi:hypothetical protein